MSTASSATAIRCAAGALGLVAFAARLPFLRLAPSPDEAGFLIVAAQWHPGHSLYGAYWVDRPPGLIALYALADLCGGLVPLRLLGAVAAAGSVLGSAWLARRVAPTSRAAPILAALLCTGLVSSTLLDVTIVDGEILALPWVLAGLASLLTAFTVEDLTRLRRGAAVDARVRGGWAMLAGGLGATALAVKQNFLEVFVATVFIAGWLVWCGARRLACALFIRVGEGALAVLVPLVVASRAAGTRLPALWEAIVPFREQAARVVAQQGSATTIVRADNLVDALVGTGMPIVILLLVLVPWWGSGRGAPVTWLCAVIGLYEGASIAAGASYWQHYLVQGVPAAILVLGRACATVTSAISWDAKRWRVRTACAAVGVVLVSSLGAWIPEAVHSRTTDPPSQAVASFLRDHGDRGTTAVVAFGNPAILWQARMASPYPFLWSLPVRVLDPGLNHLTDLLVSEAAPHWVVVVGSSLGSWGIDAKSADPVLHARYRQVFVAGDLHVFAYRVRYGALSLVERGFPAHRRGPDST